MGQTNVNELRRLGYSIELTQERLHHLLDYDPITGVFKWKNPLARNVKAGDTAGSVTSTGHIVIRVRGIYYLAHQLAWLYVFGKMVERLDHKDGERDHNAIENLREATNSQNCFNRQNLERGVYPSGKRFVAKITVDYQQMHLGTFDTKGEALEARRKAAIKYFGEFANEDQWTCEKGSKIVD